MATDPTHGPHRDHIGIDALRRSRRQRLNEEARAEYIADAEEEWRKRTGRSLTNEELERVLRRYPADE